MLMFDNAIFASFIPQMLMLFGYLSCLLAPYLTVITTTNAEIEAETLNQHQIVAVEQYCPTKLVSHTIHYFEVLNQLQSQVAEPSVFADFTLFLHVTTVFHTQNSFVISQFCTANLFSRPPPFSC